MTTQPGPHDGAGGSGDDDPAAASERAEADWLLAREHDPTAPPPSPAIARDYAALEGMLAALPPGLPDEPWKDEVLRAAAVLARSAPPRALPWWRRGMARWLLGTGFAAAAAAVLLVWLVQRPAASVDELAVNTHPRPGTRGDADHPGVGDPISITARPRGTGELRLYRPDGELIARCPSGPRCARAAAGELLIDTTLEAPGKYRIVLFVGVHGPLPDDLAAAIDQAGRAGIRVVPEREITVH